MNKETRIFILGLFYTFGGAFISVGYFNVMVEDDNINWFYLICISCGIVSTIKGLKKIDSVTKL